MKFHFVKLVPSRKRFSIPRLESPAKAAWETYYDHFYQFVYQLVLPRVYRAAKRMYTPVVSSESSIFVSEKDQQRGKDRTCFTSVLVNSVV